jgi:hypothetical protein
MPSFFLAGLGVQTAHSEAALRHAQRVYMDAINKLVADYSDGGRTVGHVPSAKLQKSSARPPPA